MHGVAAYFPGVSVVSIPFRVCVEMCQPACFLAVVVGVIVVVVVAAAALDEYTTTSYRTTSPCLGLTATRDAEALSVCEKYAKKNRVWKRTGLFV